MSEYWRKRDRGPQKWEKNEEKKDRVEMTIERKKKSTVRY